MGRTRGVYKEEFAVGSVVEIADRPTLDAFVREWKWHHPLTPEQLEFAGRQAAVKDVGFYHGGDELYHLEGVPGTWHEENLLPAEVTTDSKN